MKILCVCSQGNKRSVFTRYLLNHNHDALALGADSNSPETIALLCEWAERILLAEPIMSKKIPRRFQHKIDKDFTIGPDVYPISIAGSLKYLIFTKLKALKYIQ